MKAVFRALALATVALLAFATTAHAQFTYTYYPNDTTINSDVTTDFAIVGYASGSYDDSFNPNFSSPSSPTLQVVDGANIGSEIDTFNHSVVNISGGSESALVAYDASTINVSGGSFGFMLSFDNAVINMSDGYVSDLEGQGKGINVSGGTVDTLVANIQTDPFGNVLGNCIVNVTGGNLGKLSAFNGGTFNLRGGTYSNDLLAAFGGTINIYGKGLTATLIDPDHHIGGSSYDLFSLSGVLAGGSVLTGTNLFVRHDNLGHDGSFGQSSFNLISAAAPEPGSLALALVAGLPLVGAVVRRRRP